MQIADRDLQLWGISKNHTFPINLHNQPAGQILAAIIVTTRKVATERGENLPEVFRAESL